VKLLGENGNGVWVFSTPDATSIHQLLINNAQANAAEQTTQVGDIPCNTGK
jgi:hypothetical protein